ncbi:MAG: nucleotidyltransferase domain-containing protein [Lachnospiraceae bacterium]|nr:nucleotidyltransferase domain-containing protein [Lachnospiraceae bacterium]
MREIAKQHQVQKIVLFGSRARGDYREKSDIDLAIYGCQDFLDLSEQLEEELWSLLQLDLIDMNGNSVSKELMDEIERDGVILYEAV